MILKLLRLRKYPQENAKCIVWAHNTHIGDYHFTPMRMISISFYSFTTIHLHRIHVLVKRGEVNIGGLARKKYGEDKVALVGFSTYKGIFKLHIPSFLLYFK